MPARRHETRGQACARVCLIAPQELVVGGVLELVEDVQELRDPVLLDVFVVLLRILPAKGGALLAAMMGGDDMGCARGLTWWQ